MRFLVFFLLFTTFSVAQQDAKEDNTTYYLGELRTMSYIDLELTREGEYYIMKYRDTKSKRFRKYRSFSFTRENKHLDSLYSLMMNGFDELPKEEIEMPFTEDQVWLDFSKSAGTISVRFKHNYSDKPKDKGLSVWMTKSRVKKLFGKD